MKHVRTVRSYEGLTVTVGDNKTVAVSSEPQEVSEEAAKLIQKAAEDYGVEVEVSDEKFDVDTIRTATVGGSLAPDLSRGIGSISGYGDPVPTFDVQPDADEADDEAPGAPAQAPVTTTTTDPKGK